MNSNLHPFYSHSGKFGLHGPVLALLAGAAVAFPLGLVYAYFIKWIPFIYLNFLITIGYGFVFGFMTLMLMKFGKVRNGAVSLLCGIAVGLIAWYGSWNGHVHAIVKQSPWLLAPEHVLAVMKVLLSEGTWGIGFSSDSAVTGFPLAIVWFVEAAVIVGLTAMISYGQVADSPFCEAHGCWLDETKTIEKLDAFTRPDHIEALKNGDIAPLEEAQPRIPAYGRFARLTLKYSPHCDDYCALSIANVTVIIDEDGKNEEKAEDVMKNLWVPKTMFEYLAQFDHATARVTSRV